MLNTMTNVIKIVFVGALIVAGYHLLQVVGGGSPINPPPGRDQEMIEVEVRLDPEGRRTPVHVSLTIGGEGGRPFPITSRYYTVQYVKRGTPVRVTASQSTHGMLVCVIRVDGDEGNRTRRLVRVGTVECERP